MGKSFAGQNKRHLFKNKRRYLGAIFAAAVIFPGSAAAAQQKNNAPQGKSVATAAHVIRKNNITADLGLTKNTIPANFVSVSDELKDVISSANSGSPIFSASNTSLIGLFRLLGPNGYFRFGGETQDHYTSSNSKPLEAPPLTQPIAQDLAGFMAALGPGWTLNYGLDGQNNNSTEAVTQAGMIKTAVKNTGGGNPVTFSIGNEPNLWSQSLSSVGGCSTAQCEWTHVFNNYSSKLKSTYPDIKIDAPEYGGFPDSQLFSFINGTTAGSSHLVTISPHWYPLPNGTVDVARALSAVGSVNWSGWKGEDIHRLRMVESGLTTGGGGAIPKNSSDKKYTRALVSATWFLEMSIEAATHGWAGVGQHMVLTGAGGQLSGYGVPSDNNCVKQNGSNWSPAACFYGEYLMSMMEGQTIVGNTTSGVASPSNVTGGVYVLTTKNKSGNANMLIVNGNQNKTFNITPRQTRPWSTGEVYQLGGGCRNKNPDLNGQPIEAGGSWAGAPETLNRGGKLTIPPCGAVVIKM